MSALSAVDLNSASVDALVERYPDLGLLVAEEIVAWRGENGPFQSVSALIALGVTVELAERLIADIGRGEPEVEKDVFTAPTPRESPFGDEAELFTTHEPTAAVAVAGATSQTIRTTPTPVPQPPHSMPAPSVQVPAKAQRSGFYAIAVVTLVMANAGLGAGLVGLRHDEHETRVPIAAMSAELKDVQTKQTDVGARLEDTRARLDKQETTLAKTIEKLNAHDEHQREADHKAKEQAAHEAKEVGALAERMGRVERRFDREVYTVEEVVKAIAQEDEHAAPAHAPIHHAEPPKAAAHEHAPAEHHPAAHHE